jgi:hypothetical protein
MALNVPTMQPVLLIAMICPSAVQLHLFEQLSLALLLLTCATAVHHAAALASCSTAALQHALHAHSAAAVLAAATALQQQYACEHAAEQQQQLSALQLLQRVCEHAASAAAPAVVTAARSGVQRVHSVAALCERLLQRLVAVLQATALLSCACSLELVLLLLPAACSLWRSAATCADSHELHV